MDRSLIPSIRLSDIPTGLNSLLEGWACRFSAYGSHVHLYFFDQQVEPLGGVFEQRAAIYTDNQQYMLHAKWGGDGPGYLGCMARSRKPRAGEEQHRGSDLTDGPFTYGTWFAILGDIVSYEMVQLAKTARPVPDGMPFPSDGAQWLVQPAASD